MAIIILILAVLLLIGKKGGLYEKYETFYLDVASIINVEAVGNNIDKVIEEIMMILLDKFETPYGKEHKEEDEEPAPKPEPKKMKTLKTKKTPAPEVTPEPKVAAPEAMGEDLDLDFSSDDEPVEEKLKEEKTLNKKSLISSGFDFDDLNPDGDEIKD